jgi:hypothetical protein
MLCFTSDRSKTVAGCLEAFNAGTSGLLQHQSPPQKTVAAYHAKHEIKYGMLAVKIAATVL